MGKKTEYNNWPLGPYPILSPVKNGWFAMGSWGSVQGATEAEALAKYEESCAYYAQLDARIQHERAHPSPVTRWADLAPVPEETLEQWIMLAQERDHAAGVRTADAVDPLVQAMRDAVVEIRRLRAVIQEQQP